MTESLNYSPKKMPVVFKLLIFGVPLLTIAAVVLGAFVPSVALADLSILGMTYQCSVSQAFRSLEVLHDRESRTKAIRDSAKLIQSDGAYSLWRTRDGDFWIPERNADTLAYNLAEQEQAVYGRGSQGVHRGEVVLDGGANVGVFTRAALAAGASKVISIEPAPENVESLRRNFTEEIKSGRVVIQSVGIWDQAGELPLRVDADNSARNSFILNFGPAASFVKVPLVTIDSVVKNLGLDSVNFIKLDIEGAEKKALSGARETLARFHPRLAVAMEHLPDDPVAIPAVVNSMALGYTAISGPCLSGRPDTLYFLPR
jgi:FkbM family methyltransferase